MRDKRKPLVDQVPKALKRTGTRTRQSGIPANIRADGITVDDDDRDYIRRRLGEKLARYASVIERVSVRLRDINGPRGGDDVQCRIKVVLSGLPSVTVERTAAAFRPALAGALSSAEESVRRAQQRKRTRPLRVGR